MPDKPLQILVTNDDGVDSFGLHELARSMVELGQVTVVAPDSEYSGAAASIGSLYDDDRDVHESSIDGIDTVWTVSGPPALCVMYAHLGAFGFQPDLVVSGINPGANVGRSVYYSGTLGAAITARNYGIPGVAVSQAVDSGAVEGQAWGEIVAQLEWRTAATVAQRVVEAIRPETQIDHSPGTAPVININVPHRTLSEIDGWDWTAVAPGPHRTMSRVRLKPKPGHLGGYDVEFEFGSADEHPEPGTDVAVVAQRVSVSYISTMTAVDPAVMSATEAVVKSLDGLFAHDR